MNKLKYILWLIGIVSWRTGVPTANPAYGMRAGCVFLKHIADIDKLFVR